MDIPLIPLTALVLTAGRSRRMGLAKAWLRLQGQSLLARVACAAQDAGAARVVVVVGATEASPAGGEPAGDTHVVTGVSVEAVLAGQVQNLVTVAGCPDGHPIDSIRAGLRVVTPGHALLLWPVDHPFAGASVIRALRQALAERADRIAVPHVEGRRGHPILLGPEVVTELASPAADAGAHAVVRRDAGRVIHVPVGDSRVVADLDTPAQATALGVELPALRQT